MATSVRNIQATPMAPYAGLTGGMSREDKLAVVAFLVGTMQTTDDRTRFYRLLDEWKENTRFLSSVTAITHHESFKNIVKMGGNAVPFSAQT